MEAEFNKEIQVLGKIKPFTVMKNSIRQTGKASLK